MSVQCERRHRERLGGALVPKAERNDRATWAIPMSGSGPAHEPGVRKLTRAISRSKTCVIFNNHCV